MRPLILACALAGAAVNFHALADDGPPPEGGPYPPTVQKPLEPESDIWLPDGTRREVNSPIAGGLLPDEGYRPAGYYPVFDDIGAPRARRETGVVQLELPDGWVETGDDDAGVSTRSTPLFQDFSSMGPNGLNPPDNDLAFGYDYAVAVVNDDFAVYDRCGNELFRADINDYLNIDTSYLVFDPKVIFDPWAGRWVMFWHKKKSTTQESTMAFVVTSNSTPFGLAGSAPYWWEYNALQDSSTADESWADYYDLGYSSTTVYVSGNQFRWNDTFRWGRLRYIESSVLYSGSPPSIFGYSNLKNPDGTNQFGLRSAKLQWSWSEGGDHVDAVFVASRSGGASDIATRKFKDAYGTPVFDTADIGVTAYTVPPLAEEPNGNQLDTIDCRLMTAVATSDTKNGNGIELFTGHTIAFNSGADARCRLYKFDIVGEALEFESSFGVTGQDYWFPSVAADYSGSAYWVFTRSSNASDVFPEVRMVDFNQGAFSSASALIKAGTGNNGGFRWGDYFGGQLDWGDYNANISVPGRPAKVWLYAEHATSGSWDTHVGATSVFTQGDLSNVQPAATWVISGPPGGPFSPSSQMYTLSHTGETGTSYVAGGKPSWLDGFQGVNDIYSGGRTHTYNTNATANGLARGTYNATLTFTDCFNGGAAYNRNVQLNVQAPDLDVIVFNAANGPFHPGDTLTVTVQYKNNGNKATGAFTTNFYASTNTTITVLDENIGSRNYASLAAGATSSTFTHFLDTPCVVPGNYYIGCIATVTGDDNTADNVEHDATSVNIHYCRADWTQDCFVNGEDYDEFVADFEAGNADYNGDGFPNGDDFDEFVLDFETGCEV